MNGEKSYLLVAKSYMQMQTTLLYI